MVIGWISIKDCQKVYVTSQWSPSFVKLVLKRNSPNSQATLLLCVLYALGLVRCEVRDTAEILSRCWLTLYPSSKLQLNYTRLSG